MKWFLILTLFDPQADPDFRTTVKEYQMPSQQMCEKALDMTRDAVEEEIAKFEFDGVSYTLLCVFR